MEAADVAVAERLGEHRDHPAVRALGATSEIADQAPSLALSGAVLAVGLLSGRSRLAEAGGRMLASGALATVLKASLKRLVSRTRPNLLIEEGRYAVEALGPDEGSWHSFPSGHTAGAVALARALVRVYPEASIPTYAVAAAIAAVQVPRAKHYPLDVAGGIAVGAVAEALVARALQALRDKHDAEN